LSLARSIDASNIRLSALIIIEAKAEGNEKARVLHDEDMPVSSIQNKKNAAKMHTNTV